LRTYSGKKDDGIIWVCFYINRQKVNFSTGVKTDIKSWSAQKCQVLKSDSSATDKNLVIENIIARINNVFVKYRLKDRKLTRESFFRAYNRPDDYDSFFDFVKDNYSNINSRNELSTSKAHNSVLKKVREYAPELHFDDITTEWLDRYFRHLVKDLRNNENTAYKNMATFKKYVRYAVKKGYMDENPFEEWIIRRMNSGYTYLTEEELSRFIKMYANRELEHKYHRTLEFFLFMCFSSLHITDAKNLRLEQFTDTSFTYFRIKNRNKKPEAVNVPVSDALCKLLVNIVGPRKKGCIFEHLPAEQTMNRYLKEIAKIAGIDKDISNKTGRHTFATYYLAKTKDITSLKEILGHSELRETLIYAHVLDESKQEGITCFNSFDL
jgi:site-specific recombinase XerD